MRLIICCLLSVACCLKATAQKNYWQQETNYRIEVTLDDSLHVLRGFITIEYKNNSPDTLRSIYMHLWPNAYRDGNSAFAKQQLENGDRAFHYSKERDRGFIDSLKFKADAEVLKWEYDAKNLDIALLHLNRPLIPHASVSLTTPFRVKIPSATFSRMGHMGQAYYITQWFPKPAVYDKYGWHPMPYLSQGEFYSEFGSFDVSITLPASYIVGATGDLQTESERAFMDSLALLKPDTASAVPPTSHLSPLTVLKTLRFTQSRVHDFAWFANKNFRVQKGEVELPNSKRKVTTWALFTEADARYWKRAPEYLRDAIYYYSLWNGDYAYNQVTAIDGTISAGGGMEYPNITVINSPRSALQLDDIIAHEVGHNWFYGMLASNEREHPWLDEGINSYYEYRYIRTKYPNQKMTMHLPRTVEPLLGFRKHNFDYLPYLGYWVAARENSDQPIEGHATNYTAYNYSSIVYGKTKLAFDYLEAVLGTEVFDACMKKYFALWCFKHPHPEDLRAVFENETKQDLGWFFDELLKSNRKLNFSVGRKTKAKGQDQNTTRIRLKNKSGLRAPALLSWKKDSAATVVLTPFEKDTLLTIPPDAEGVYIDAQEHMPDANRANNFYRIKGPHRPRKFKLKIIPAFEEPNEEHLYIFPYIGWNNYDKTQVGVVLYNTVLPTRRFSWLIAPAFATGSLNICGYGRMSVNLFPENKPQRITIGLIGKRFSYLLFPKNLTFNKLEPFIEFELKKKRARSPFVQTVKLRSVIAFLERLDFDDKKEWQRYYVNELKYSLTRNSTLHPFNVSLTFQQSDKFLKAALEANFKITYKKSSGFGIRIFAGGFPVYNKSASDINAPNPRVYLSNATTPAFAYWLQKDYMLDENFVDRNGRDKVFARQVAMTDGAFRSVTNFGSTSKFMSAVNVTSSLHRWVPLFPFAGMAMLADDNNKFQLAAEAGVSIGIRDYVLIHFPLLTTANIRESHRINGIDKFYERITFTLKLPAGTPLSWLRKLVK